MRKIALLPFLLLITPAIARADVDEGCFNDMMGLGWYPWGGWGMVIVPLLWILLVGGIAILLIKGFSGNDLRQGRGKPGSALGILKERYAKGEIDKKKFEEMKKDLEQR